MKDEDNKKIITKEIKDPHDIERCLEDIVTDDEKLKNAKKEIEDCMLKNGWLIFSFFFF